MSKLNIIIKLDLKDYIPTNLTSYDNIYIYFINYHFIVAILMERVECQGILKEIVMLLVHLIIKIKFIK